MNDLVVFITNALNNYNVLLYGPEQSGKTTLGLLVAALYDGPVVWVDGERALNVDYALQLGVDLNKFVRVAAPRALCSSDLPADALIVIDTLVTSAKTYDLRGRGRVLGLNQMRDTPRGKISPGGLKLNSQFDIHLLLERRELITKRIIDKWGRDKTIRIGFKLKGQLVKGTPMYQTYEKEVLLG